MLSQKNQETIPRYHQTLGTSVINSQMMSHPFLTLDRVGPDIRIFSMSNRILDIKTIRTPDIRLIFNARYLIICRVSDTKNQPDIQYLVPGRIYGYLSDIRHQKLAGYLVFFLYIRHKNQPDIRYSVTGQKVSDPTLVLLT